MAADLPAWQWFCYGRTGWRKSCCFFCAGLIGLSPAPYYDAGRIYSRGRLVAAVALLMAIPVGLFGLGFLLG